MVEIAAKVFFTVQIAWGKLSFFLIDISWSTPSGYILTFEQRLILSSENISFFLVPLTTLLDMASWVYRLVSTGSKMGAEKWE